MVDEAINYIMLSNRTDLSGGCANRPLVFRSKVERVSLLPCELIGVMTARADIGCRQQVDMRPICNMSIMAYQVGYTLHKGWMFAW